MEGMEEIIMGAHALAQDISNELFLPRMVKSQPAERRNPLIEKGYVYRFFTNYGPYDTIEAFGTSVTPIIQDVATPTLSVSGQVQRIETRLGLNRSQLAKALNVTRKTIYDWCNKGSKLSDTRTEERLQKLLQITNKQTDEAMGKYYGVNLQRPVLDGESLLDILTDEVIDEDKAKAALKTVASLAAESKTRMKAFARKKPSPLPDYEAQATIDHIAPRT